MAKSGVENWLAQPENRRENKKNPNNMVCVVCTYIKPNSTDARQHMAIKFE